MNELQEWKLEMYESLAETTANLNNIDTYKNKYPMATEIVNKSSYIIRAIKDLCYEYVANVKEGDISDREILNLSHAIDFEINYEQVCNICDCTQETLLEVLETFNSVLLWSIDKRKQEGAELCFYKLYDDVFKDLEEELEWEREIAPCIVMANDSIKQFINDKQEQDALTENDLSVINAFFSLRCLSCGDLDVEFKLVYNGSDSESQFVRTITHIANEMSSICIYRDLSIDKHLIDSCNYILLEKYYPEELKSAQKLSIDIL